MVRRIGTFLTLILLIAAVSSLVYFNAQETLFRLTPEVAFTLPLGVLMLAAGVAGAVLMFVLAMMREGRHALRDWLVHRELRSAQRSVESIAEARSLTLAGDYKRARSLLARATQKRSPEIGDVIDYAETFLLEDDPMQARRVLEEGQKDFGNEPLLLFALARTCRAAGDAAAAISSLERALAVYPRSLPLLTMLRDILFETESWERAEEVQRRIVELKPNDASESNWLLGARFEAAARAEESTRETGLRSLCQDDPDFAPAVVARARELDSSGDPRRAGKLLEKAARRRPRGAVLDEYERIVGTDDPLRTAKLYQKLIAANPTSSQLKVRAARYLAGSGREEDAAGVLDSLTDNGQPPYAQAVWAEIHDARHNADLAHSSYREAFTSGGLGRPEFVCEICGAHSEHWHARCDGCGAWGMLESL